MGTPRQHGSEVELLREGTVLVNRFIIEEVIGMGGMGVVYRALDRKLGRIVAIKTIREWTRQAVKRFECEAVAVAQIESHNVVKVFDVFVGPDEVPYMVMEFLDGGNMEEQLEEMRAADTLMPVKYAVDVMLGATRAVAEAHACGITHRDLKPANIFVVTSGPRMVVKVLDFGLSSSEKTKGLTRPGLLVGTPMYSAPERVGGKSDERSDLYSLGVVLYEFLSGEPPFTGEDDIEVIRAAQVGKTRRLELLRPDLPAELAELVHRAMAPNPADRFKTVHALGRALLPFGGEGAMAHREFFEGEELARHEATELRKESTITEAVAEINALRERTSSRVMQLDDQQLMELASLGSTMREPSKSEDEVVASRESVDPGRRSASGDRTATHSLAGLAEQTGSGGMVPEGPLAEDRSASLGAAPAAPPVVAGQVNGFTEAWWARGEEEQALGTSDVGPSSVVHRVARVGGKIVGVAALAALMLGGIYWKVGRGASENQAGGVSELEGGAAIDSGARPAPTAAVVPTRPSGDDLQAVKPSQRAAGAEPEASPSQETAPGRSGWQAGGEVAGRKGEGARRAQAPDRDERIGREIVKSEEIGVVGMPIDDRAIDGKTPGKGGGKKGQRSRGRRSGRIAQPQPQGHEVPGINIPLSAGRPRVDNQETGSVVLP